MCLSCRVGVCGLGGPGQRPLPAVSGDLLVPVLPSLLLLLRAVLLLSRHLLLPTTPSVESVSLFSSSSLSHSLAVEIYLAALLSCSVYEAGKMAKRHPPAPLPVYPYYVPGVPTVVPVSVAPSSHMEPKITSLPSVETNLAGGESSFFFF